MGTIPKYSLFLVPQSGALRKGAFKYGIFVAKICKYALIDRFQGSAGFLDNAASLAALHQGHISQVG